MTGQAAADISGQRYGHLVVLRRDGTYSPPCNPKRKVAIWLCQCDCGDVTRQHRSSLKRGLVKTCGGIAHSSANPIGRTFGYLTFKCLGQKTKKKPTPWVCMCCCGKEVTLSAKVLLRHTSGRLSCGCRDRELRIKARGTAVISAYVARARECNLEFSISKEECERLFSGPCAYCDTPPSNVVRTNEDRVPYSGIDRVDNTKGYVPGNVVSCCKRCNTWKSSRELEDFVVHARTVASNLTNIARWKADHGVAL